ncbi:MAG TPA: Asp23/Gls24 family envelope stress response protein [Clostridiales bacterium]|nr:Asp23/Gls24 family envelope stress response protein [Clostridiales bacterium]
MLDEVDNGTEGIKIASDVIAVISGVAVSEVKGVFAMAGGFAGGITEVLKGKKNLAKGIKVETENNKAKIDVNIIVEYGARIPDVAFEIQNKVKKSVEEMTGLKVEEVNVHVQGVNTQKLTEDEVEDNIDEENTTEE